MNPNDAVIPTVSTTVDCTIDDDGNIHLSLRSEGMNPKEYDSDFKAKGFIVSERGRDVLLHAVEQPTSSVVYHIVIRPMSGLFGKDRSEEKVSAHAFRKGWQKPHWEVACLMRTHLSSRSLEKMGLAWLVPMHESIEDSDGKACRLVLNRGGDGLLSLQANDHHPEQVFYENVGCAFVVPAQV